MRFLNWVGLLLLTLLLPACSHQSEPEVDPALSAARARGIEHAKAEIKTRSSSAPGALVTVLHFAVPW